MSYPKFLHEVLYEAAKHYMATREPVFRAKAIGFTGSSARIQQDAEDKLLAAIASYEGQPTTGRL